MRFARNRDRSGSPVQFQTYYFETGGGDRRKPPHRLQNKGFEQTG